MRIHSILFVVALALSGGAWANPEPQASETSSTVVVFIDGSPISTEPLEEPQNKWLVSRLRADRLATQIAARTIYEAVIADPSNAEVLSGNILAYLEHFYSWAPDLTWALAPENTTEWVDFFKGFASRLMDGLRGHIEESAATHGVSEFQVIIHFPKIAELLRSRFMTKLKAKEEALSPEEHRVAFVFREAIERRWYEHLGGPEF